ncbi:MAG: hypothetical protein IPM46_09920 [Flavobacteriales bacterium]|nr:hypothetical protein [Flavobacteriales bacterium]
MRHAASRRGPSRQSEIREARDDELKARFTEHFGPGFLNDIPMDKHLSVFKQLRADIGTNRIERVEQLSPEEFAVLLVSERDQSRWRVMMQSRRIDARISGWEWKRWSELAAASSRM